MVHTLIDAGEPAVRAGLFVAVIQNPFRMGYLGVQAIVNHLQGKAPQKRIDTGATVVTASNLKDAAVQELLNPLIDKYLK